MTRGARLLAVGFAAAALAWTDAASAQSCTAESPGSTRCRFVLSDTQVLTVESGALLARDAGGSSLAIRVDGRPCVTSQTVLKDRVLSRCKVRLPAATHLLTAKLSNPSAAKSGVGVRLWPSPRLAALPRERLVR